MNGPVGRFRLVYAAFVSAMVAIGAVVLTLDATIEDSDTVPGAAVVGVVALFGLVGLAAAPLVERPLDCSTDMTLATGWSARFFLRMAFAEAPVLVAFTVFVLTGRAWAYAVGLPFAAVAFVRSAPTEAGLDRDQYALDQAGCGRSLRDALAAASPEPG